MNKQEKYEMQLTEDNYAFVIDYLTRNSVKHKRTAKSDIFEFIRGEIVINDALKLSGSDISREIREGIEKIILENRFGAGQTTGTL